MGAIVAPKRFKLAKAVESHCILLLLEISQIEGVWSYSEQRTRLVIVATVISSKICKRNQNGQNRNFLQAAKHLARYIKSL
jgi:hypothetical protein